MENEQTAGKVGINDGKGLYDSEGLVDTLIIDLNGLTKALVSGEFVQYSGLILQMYRKLLRLKEGIATDKEKLMDQIKELKDLNNELAEKAFRATANDGGGEADGSPGNSEKE